jgi:hypothetical protein
VSAFEWFVAYCLVAMLATTIEIAIDQKRVLALHDEMVAPWQRSRTMFVLCIAGLVLSAPLLKPIGIVVWLLRKREG